MHKNRSCSFILVFLAVFLFAGCAVAIESPLYLPIIPGFKITNKKPCDKIEDPNCKGDIPLGNCDPTVDPLHDGDVTQNYQKSCSGQNITRENFKVKVTFDPKKPSPFVGTSATIIEDGGATLPLCNSSAIQNAANCNEKVCPWSKVLDTCNSKDNQNASSCGQKTCPNTTGCVPAANRIIVKNPNNCYALKEVQYINGNLLQITPLALALTYNMLLQTTLFIQELVGPLPIMGIQSTLNPAHKQYLPQERFRRSFIRMEARYIQNVRIPMGGLQNQLNSQIQPENVMQD